ncbi:uncharacterized protein LOC144951757 isoform X4 [Lampetra fluviatilis]
MGSQRAEALLKRPHASDDLVECALSSCFNNTECFHNYDHELAQNPASHRVFNLTLCAFVSTDYPLECDHRNCTLEIAACKHLTRRACRLELWLRWWWSFWWFRWYWFCSSSTCED